MKRLTVGCCPEVEPGVVLLKLAKGELPLSLGRAAGELKDF